MNCEAVRALLWAYLEKETTAEETVKIEEHLKACADCREELELQKKMMETLAGLPEVELPEGYHTELMQKLQAEAASNVVPFPVRKKKQPVWKQWGMIAAAVLVVVAAGGMNGMLEMRKEQQTVVQEEMRKDQGEGFVEMKTADAATSLEDLSVAEDAADTVAEPQKNTQSSGEKKNETKVETATETTVSKEKGSDDMDAAAVPKAASMDTAEEEISGFSVTRSAKLEAADKMTLLVTDAAAAMAEIQKAIVEAGGFEEATETDGIFAAIPVENYDGFIKAMEAIGTVEWTMQGAVAEGAMYHTIEIQLKKS